MLNKESIIKKEINEKKKRQKGHLYGRRQSQKYL